MPPAAISHCVIQITLPTGKGTKGFKIKLINLQLLDMVGLLILKVSNGISTMKLHRQHGESLLHQILILH